MNDALGRAQSVLVLGGTSEIAQATVRALVARGARRVVLAGRRPEALEAVAAALRAAGAPGVQTLRWDADDPETHEAVVEQAWAGGDVDLVLVAAGVLGEQEVAERSPAATRAILQTNFVGLASTMVAVAERLRAQGHGVLVVLSSVAAERPRRANFVYASSKAGLDAFAQGLGDALVGTGPRVLVVRPGFVHTKMTAGRPPAPFSTTPQAVAEAIVAGLASGAHTVWAPRGLRVLMAVVRALPRPLFRRYGS
jgi:decaprenylphospho-beta-D-erythro-pentofuranosid-2-ulose 2-reductase